jgi:hypothetical protein
MAIVVRHNPTKWQKRAAAAASDYATGVQSPRTPWHVAVAAAGDAYVAGVQQAIADNRYQNSATPANTQKQQQKAASLGAQRYAPGVNASTDAYDKGMKPYIQTLQTLDLPARGAKGDPANYLRSQLVGQALYAKKVALKSS